MSTILEAANIFVHTSGVTGPPQTRLRKGIFREENPIRHPRHPGQITELLQQFHPFWNARTNIADVVAIFLLSSSVNWTGACITGSAANGSQEPLCPRRLHIVSARRCRWQKSDDRQARPFGIREFCWEIRYPQGGPGIWTAADRSNGVRKNGPCAVGEYHVGHGLWTRAIGGCLFWASPVCLGKETVVGFCRNEPFSVIEYF